MCTSVAFVLQGTTALVSVNNVASIKSIYICIDLPIDEVTYAAWLSVIKITVISTSKYKLYLLDISCTVGSLFIFDIY